MTSVHNYTEQLPVPGNLPIQENKMKQRALIALFTFLLGLLPLSNAHAAFVIQQEGTLDLKETPIDIAASANGQWSFVLTAEGNIHVLAANGATLQRISGAKGYDRIEFTAGNRLILTSSKTRKFKIIVLDQVHILNNTGLPFKGPANAPVEVAVFDDFQ